MLQQLYSHEDKRLSETDVSSRNEGPPVATFTFHFHFFTSSLSRNEGALLSLANLTSNFFTFPGMRGLPPVATFSLFSVIGGLPPVATFTFHFHLFTFTFARNEGAPSCCYYLHCGNFDYPVVPDTANDIENAKDYNER